MNKVANTLHIEPRSQLCVSIVQESEYVDAQVQTYQSSKNVKHRSEPSNVAFDDILLLFS